MNARTWDRTLIYGSAILLALWVIVPFYLIFLSAFSRPNDVFVYPKPLIPTNFSTETMEFFLQSTGVFASVLNSIAVALITIVLSLALGAPAGYALARFTFRGRQGFQLIVLATKMFPVAILSIPLAVTFVRLGLYDNVIGVALVHTAMALPFVILVTLGVFAGVSNELEEAAMTLGCSRFTAFLRIALPLALPGLAAAAIFTFVISWNEVFAASILTLRQRTLPAQVLSALQQSPLYFKFAGGFFMVMPAVVFIFFMRRYLLNLWGGR
ncbi:MAG TPA: carbohydrate ABC transporter permease [Candidatus Limnocylindria bacterium]|jgi:multiple sugar transport system permease protein|nr:carbohydrate ABC transporter permease [Candidatus Limnocylindria bacterium]